MTDPNRRDKFNLPEGVIYLDGNSLGPLPSHVPQRLANATNEAWGRHLIKAWNEDDWIGLPGRIGDRIARMIGAPKGTVRACDSTSINLYKLLSAAIEKSGKKGIVLSDTGNFPTDLYVAQGLVASEPNISLKLVDPEDIEDAITPDVCVVMLTQVDYRTGRRHNMERITNLSHEAGALILWDLAHSAGALDVDLEGVGADFAVGCGYKYLNGGPGAPAFLYVAEQHHDTMSDVAGWFGHAEPFAFETEFRAASGIDRFTVGTPPVLSMVALDGALDLFDDVKRADVAQRSTALTQLFIDEISVFADAYDLVLATPIETKNRGSHVSWHHPNAYPVMQALISLGVIGDMRAPDYLRFGFAPLYNTDDEVRRAAAILREVLETGSWDQPQFHARKAVT
ncbi:MAG: kynureninase [Pseudomonadota bacterium]